jgi:hypothetical protein
MGQERGDWGRLLPSPLRRLQDADCERTSHTLASTNFFEILMCILILWDQAQTASRVLAWSILRMSFLFALRITMNP